MKNCRHSAKTSWGDCSLVQFGTKTGEHTVLSIVILVYNAMAFKQSQQLASSHGLDILLHTDSIQRTAWGKRGNSTKHRENTNMR